MPEDHQSSQNISGPFYGQDHQPEKEPAGRGKALQTLINLLTILFLAAVVLASGWISFQLSRKIIFANKELPKPRIDVAIPETPPSIKAMQKLQQVMSQEAKPVVVAPQPAPVVVAPRRVAARKVTQRTNGAHYYKVQAGVFEELSAARDMEGKIREAGFDVFVKPVEEGWRVQAGALKSKSQADAVSSDLSEKGFKSEIVFE